MAGLSVFMKRRIQQLVEEYQDPQLVLEQLQNAVEDMTAQDEEEITDYLFEICPVTPYDDMPMTDDPVDFLQQLFGGDGKFNLTDEDSEIMDEMLDMVESGIEEAHFTAVSFLEELSEESSIKFRESGMNLSPYTDIITSLPIIKDTKTLLETMGKEKIQLKLTKTGDYTMNTIKKVHTVLSESPYIKGTKVPRKKDESTYIMMILNLLESTGFFDRKDNAVIIAKDVENRIENRNFDAVSIYWKLFRSIFFKEDDPDFFNTFGAFANFTLEFTLFPALLSIGEEWRNFNEAIMPVLTEGNLPLRNDIAHLVIATDELKEFIEAYGYWLSDVMEKMAIWETRKENEHLTEIRLTKMGRGIMEEIFSSYPVPCKIYGKLIASKSASNYINFQISTGPAGQMKIRNSDVYEKYVKVNNDMDTFYLDFIESVLNPEKVRELMGQMNTNADEIISRMTDSITGLKNFMDKK